LLKNDFIILIKHITNFSRMLARLFDFGPDLEDFIKTNMAQYERDLQRLVRIRSESQDPTHRDNLTEVLNVGRSILERLGYDSIHIDPNDGSPILTAMLAGNGKKKVTVYGHMDVQPVSNDRWDLAGWDMKDPFDPKIKEGVMRGRGTTDDKGPSLAVAYGLSFLPEQDRPDIELIWETKEENGSVGFGKFLDDNRSRLQKPDMVLISDTIFEGDNPAITYSLRGLLRVEPSLTGPTDPNAPIEVLEVIGGHSEEGIPTKIYPAAAMNVAVRDGNLDQFMLFALRHLPGDSSTGQPGALVSYLGRDVAQISLISGKEALHSGLFGGVAVNPLTVLSSVVGQYIFEQDLADKGLSPLTTLTNLVWESVNDGTGKVQIPSFYDGVHTVSAVERDSFATIARSVDLAADFRGEGLIRMYTEDGVEMRERLWRKPTFEVHGYTKNDDTATVKLTMRLVDEQDPETIRTNLEAMAHRIHQNITVSGDGVHGISTSIDNPFMTLAASACTYGFGRPAVFAGCGGTIGSVPEFQRIWGVPVVLVAQSKMSDGYHRPNEQFEMAQAGSGMKTIAKLAYEVAHM
jgi:acetylornithine deacetylase/succinyl-diaminopimelate desuccinylase-like protein